VEEVAERARRVIEWAVQHGTTILRTAHAVQFTMPQEIETLFDMPTTNAARLLRLPQQDYGIREGAIASLNVIAAPNAAEAFRTRADRRYVIRRGRIVAETVTTKKVYRAS
jgi:cytosine/adenosine deaminase-related metal-dependent hydrolase